MSNAKHTPGPWTVNANKIDGNGYHIISVNASATSEGIANALLIAEAGTVAHETGMTPRQLAESHARLLAALEALSGFAQALMDDQVLLFTACGVTIHSNNDALVAAGIKQMADAAISQAKGL